MFDAVIFIVLRYHSIPALVGCGLLDRVVASVAFVLA
jgi:hypothetical protein